MRAIDPQSKKIIEQFYYKKGYSAREIAMEFNVSLDAVYYFMRKEQISRRDRSSSRQVVFERKKLSFVITQPLSPEQKKLKLFALALYWGEGAKSRATVDFSNSDPLMCKVFIRFLREICGVDETRLRGYIYCHESQDLIDLLSFWSQHLQIPSDQFSKTYVRKKQRGKHRHQEKMPHGLVHIRYNDLKLLRLILQWIEEEAKNLGR